MEEIGTSYDRSDLMDGTFVKLGLLTQLFKASTCPKLEDYNVNMYVSIVGQR